MSKPKQEHSTKLEKYLQEKEQAALKFKLLDEKRKQEIINLVMKFNLLNIDDYYIAGALYELVEYHKKNDKEQLNKYRTLGQMFIKKKSRRAQNNKSNSTKSDS